MIIKRLNLLPSLVLITLFVPTRSICTAQHTDTSFSSHYELSKTTDLTEKLSLLLLSAQQETNAKNAVEYAETAINLADSLRQEGVKAEALHLSGIAWKRWGDNLKSAERLNQALNIYTQSGNNRKAAQVQRDLGETYRAARGYDFSENALRIALEYFHSVNDPVELAKTYNRLAATRFEVVFTNFELKLIDSLIKSGWNSMEAVLQLFPEFSYTIDSAKSALNKATNLSVLLKMPDLIISNQIISVALSAMEMDYNKTQADYDKIIQLMHQYNDYQDLPLVLINKARTYGWQMMKQPEKAIPLAHQALNLAQQNNIRMYEYLAAEILHENYRETGNYEKAYFYANKIRSLFLQFHNEDLTLHLKTQGLEFEIKARELEIKNRRIQLVMLIISSFMIAVILILFTTILIGKNRKLAKLLNELHAITKIISEKNEKLASANADKDRFFSIIAHDLRSPFNAFLGFTELMTNETYNLTKEEMKNYAQEIRKSALLLFDLLENLLEWSRLQRNLIALNKQEYPLIRLVEMSLNALTENAQKKEISIAVDFDKQLTVLADDKMMQSVFRNLISNAIKFTNRGGSVKITAQRKVSEIIVAVSDTGIGIKPENVAKLFKIDQTISAYGTEGEPSSGLGLILCREFIEKHEGKIWVESEVRIGSTFYFSLQTNMN
jgi:signal transduction histidine kinase